MKEQTEWHRVSFFGRLAEIVNEYLKKGSSVYIEGRIRTRKWTDQAGQERYSTEIVADQMQMLGGRATGDRSSNDGFESQRPARQGRSEQPRASSNAAPAHREPQSTSSRRRRWVCRHGRRHPISRLPHAGVSGLRSDPVTAHLSSCFSSPSLLRRTGNGRRSREAFSSSSATRLVRRYTPFPLPLLKKAARRARLARGGRLF